MRGPRTGQAPQTLVIGAGPGRAHRRLRAGQARRRRSTVLEADAVVGGISRTVERDGWRFDIGGHRFFTKVQRGRGPLARDPRPTRTSCCGPRMSRIYYHGKFYDYPLKADATRCATSARSRPSAACCSYALGAGPPAEGPDQLRGLASSPASAGGSTALLQDLHREGLGRARPARSPADWAAQRIKNLSLGQRDRQRAAAQARTRRRSPRLIEEFQYPKYGPGMMWERCRDQVAAPGHQGRDRAPRSSRIRARRTAGAVAVDRRAPTAASTAYPCTDVDLVDADLRAAARRWTRRSPRRGARRGRRPALPRLPHRRARRARGVRLPRQLDLHPRPRA